MSPQGEGWSPSDHKAQTPQGFARQQKIGRQTYFCYLCKARLHKKKTSARLDLTEHKDGRDNVDIWRLIRNPLVNLIISIKFVTPKVK